MQFVHIDTFLPYVLPYAEKCPQLVARRAIRDTIIDFAKRVGAYTVRATMQSVKGEHNYIVELPSGIVIDMVESVKVGNFRLAAINRAMLAQLYPNSDWHDIPGQPQYYLHQDDARQLSIVPAPTTDGLPIELEMKVTFTRQADEFPEIFYSNYVEAIAAGALSRVLAISGQTFSNAGMAMQWAQIYASYVNEAVVNTRRDFTKEAGRVVFRNIL